MTNRILVSARSIVVAAIIGLLGCGDDGPETPPGSFDWVSFTFGPGTVVNAAIYQPSSPPKGVILAFPWGLGVHQQLLSMLDSYWIPDAVEAGYVVMGMEMDSRGLVGTGRQLMPKILEWVDIHAPAGAHNIVFTGASSGGIGVFHAALAAPDRVAAIVGIPGAYTGEVETLAPLEGTRVLLMVGERDGPWVGPVEETRDKLLEANLDVTHEVLGGQPHVLSIQSSTLLEWIEAGS